MPRPRKLSEEAQLYVVHALACFEGLEEVVAGLKREFRVDVTRQAVQRYDPTTKAGEGCRDKWLEIFTATRKAYLDEQAKVGISHRTVRLQYLDRIARAAISRQNHQMALAAIELAEKMQERFYARGRQLLEDPSARRTGRVVFYRPTNGRGGEGAEQPDVTFVRPSSGRRRVSEEAPAA